MESENAYLARKAREVALIERCFADRRSVNRPTSAAVAIEEKFRLAAELRARRSLDSWAITETARPEVARWRVGAYRFSFGYQRADLEVQGPPIYDALRPLRRAVRHRTLYTGSGMSAITAAITALLHLHRELEVLVPRGFYNETRELLASFGHCVATVPRLRAGHPGFARCGTTRVMLLDSSVSKGFDAYRRKPQTVHALLFDTTCYTASSTRIGVAIDWAVRSQLPIVLVRSHAKLDSLGVEYGRLGSIVCVWPRSAARTAWIEALPQEIGNVVRLHGVAAIPAHFPPFSGTDEYRRCTRARTASILRATRSMARRMTESLGPTSVRTFQHGLYLALVPDSAFALGDVKRLAGEMCRELGQQGLPVRHAGSFGFDFVAVEWFPDPVLRRNVIRVAGGDLPASIVERIGDGIAKWWARRRACSVDARKPRTGPDPEPTAS